MESQEPFLGEGMRVSATAMTEPTQNQVSVQVDGLPTPREGQLLQNCLSGTGNVWKCVEAI